MVVVVVGENGRLPLCEGPPGTLESTEVAAGNLQVKIWRESMILGNTPALRTRGDWVSRVPQKEAVCVEDLNSQR